MDTTDPDLIIFVCTSNTCRSPMAEALGHRWVQKQVDGNRRFRIISRAICEDYEPEGSPASAQGVQVMNTDYGIDINRHRSRLLRRDEVRAARAIFGVTRSHVRAISTMFPEESNGKLKPLSRDVSDPWHQPVHVYRQCAAQLEPLVEEALESLL